MRRCVVTVSDIIPHHSIIKRSQRLVGAPEVHVSTQGQSKSYVKWAVTLYEATKFLDLSKLKAVCRRQDK